MPEDESSENPPSHIRFKRWFNCPDEQHYLPDNRKETKLERKIASSTDRSKYKKTDRDKIQNKTKRTIDYKDLIAGKVISISPQGIQVDSNGSSFMCSLKGSFKKDKSRLKNLITVGDLVWFELSQNQEGSIVKIEERRSILSRADHLSRRKEQLLAANIDQVLITVSVVTPPLKPALIDRYIIAAEKGNMQPIIVVNKIDLLPNGPPSEQKLFQNLISTYADLGIPILAISTVTGEGLNNLIALMQDKTSVFSGQSGTGKSSLINCITQLQLPTGEVVDKTNKGAHTTTSAQLLPLSFGGWCIDTPGIRSFGVWRLDKEEVEGYFPEILKYSLECKYPSCRHLQEPGCAVRSAVETGEISQIRYDSYQKIVTDEDWEIPY